MSNHETEYIERFDLRTRVQHIILITSFTTLAVTGLPQSFAQTGWAQAFMGLFGGLDGIRKVHHLAATVLVFMFVYHFFNVVFDLIGGCQKLMLPGLQDAKDAVLQVKFLLGKSEDKPQYDRFDFRQKLEYWALIWGTAVMALTGLVLMFPQLFTKFMPGVVVYAAKAAHGLEALLAILSIITWHMYNTHFAEGMWPLDKTIFTGKISKERMEEEHPLEFARMVDQASETSAQASEAAE